MDTAASRRGAIDVARAASLLLVVAGHLAMVVIDRAPDSGLRGDNILALFPRWAWLGLFSPMPVFFAAAGWSHAGHSRADSPARTLTRIRPLVIVGAVVAVTWSVASLVAIAVAGEGSIVPDGARLATQPLWFLAAYVPFVVAAPSLTRISRRPVVAVASAAALVALTDVLRFGRDWPRAVGFVGFFLVWGVPWVLGAWWRSAAPRDGWHERRTGILAAFGALAACALLVTRFGYSPSLIDAVPGRRTNTTPPTLFTLVASVAQVGAFMVVARRLDAVAGRFARRIDAIGRAAVGVYAWHLTALALCGALLAAGAWAPDRFSAGWWVTRPVWFAAVALVALGFVRLTMFALPRTTPASGSTRVPPPRDGHRVLARARIGVATVAVTAGSAVVGLYGPRTTPAALVVLGCYLLGLVAVTVRPAC